jgi:hypothetical protein
MVEDGWLKAARDMVPSHDGGSMWLMLAIGFMVQFETGWGN